MNFGIVEHEWAARSFDVDAMEAAIDQQHGLRVGGFLLSVHQNLDYSLAPAEDARPVFLRDVERCGGADVEDVDVFKPLAEEMDRFDQRCQCGTVRPDATIDVAVCCRGWENGAQQSTSERRQWPARPRPPARRNRDADDRDVRLEQKDSPADRIVRGNDEWSLRLAEPPFSKHLRERRPQRLMRMLRLKQMLQHTRPAAGQASAGKNRRPILYVELDNLCRGKSQPYPERNDPPSRSPGDQVKVIDTHRCPVSFSNAANTPAVNDPLMPPPSRAKMRKVIWATRSLAR